MSTFRTTGPMPPAGQICVLAIALCLLSGCRRAAVPAGDRPAAPSVTPAALKNPPAAENSAQPARPASPPVAAVDLKTFTDHVAPFLSKHCYKCHGAEKAEAKIRLDTLAADFLQRPAADQWVEVLDRLNLGEMPPEDEPKPPAEELTRLTDWITSEQSQARQRAQLTGGRVLLRRLTRLEYANTVRDLLRVEFAGGQGPLVQLPPDGSLAGFNRVSKALLLDPSLMEAYLSVAQQVADQAIVFRPPLVPQRTLRYEFEHTAFNGAINYQLSHRSNELDGQFMVVMETSARTFGKLRHPYGDKEIPLTGRYRIRVRASADPGERGEPVFMDVTYGADGLQSRFRVLARKDAPQIYEFEKTFDAFTPGEFHVGIANGTRFTFGNAEWHEKNIELTRLAEEGNMLEATRMKARLRAEGAYDHYVRGSYLPQALHTEKLPKLYLDWIEVIGPLQGDYPPASMRAVFGNAERAARFAASGTGREQLLDDARSVFTDLLPRAFRRLVRDAEVEQIVSLVAAELEAGADPQTALKTGIVAMLCAPDFLFLFEPADPARGDAPRALNDCELATRLSYFLWSTMPDVDLTRLAHERKLREPGVLTAQVDRMLSDPKIEGFVDGFARQWLKVDEFGRFPPDEQIYPDFYATEMAGISADVKQEPLAFFREVLARDEPLESFLDSDWLMLNERLAKLYGIEGVMGPELRRVALQRGADAAPAQQRRGGLLGMAGMHLWGADGNRTKPVERGKYILTVLFNDPPPPPPPNAGEVEPNLRGETLTVRERLARHRAHPTCNHCHRRIDPYGLALENFNVIGQWRDRLDGEKPLAHWGSERPLIDVAGTLPSGRDFADFPEFKQALRDQRQRFVRGLCEKLVVYAIGRTLEPADRDQIDYLLATSQTGEVTLQTLLKGIAASHTFQSK